MSGRMVNNFNKMRRLPLLRLPREITEFKDQGCPKERGAQQGRQTRANHAVRLHSPRFMASMDDVCCRISSSISWFFRSASRRDRSSMRRRAVVGPACATSLARASFSLRLASTPTRFASTATRRARTLRRQTSMASALCSSCVWAREAALSAARTALCLDSQARSRRSATRRRAEARPGRGSGEPVRGRRWAR